MISSEFFCSLSHFGAGLPVVMEGNYNATWRALALLSGIGDKPEARSRERSNPSNFHFSQLPARFPRRRRRSFLSKRSRKPLSRIW